MTTAFSLSSIPVPRKPASAIHSQPATFSDALLNSPAPGLLQKSPAHLSVPETPLVSASRTTGKCREVGPAPCLPPHRFPRLSVTFTPTVMFTPTATRELSPLCAQCVLPPMSAQFAPSLPSRFCSNITLTVRSFPTVLFKICSLRPGPPAHFIFLHGTCQVNRLLGHFFSAYPCARLLAITQRGRGLVCVRFPD